MFGNTQSVAKAVAEGLSSRMDTEIVEVGSAPLVVGDDVALLVVGGPTHAFGMSRPGTREQAADQAKAALVSQGIGLREWLDALEAGPPLAMAAFDTRIDKPRVPGSAGRAAGKRLRRLGLRMLAPTESFYVTGTEGPLLDGELDRARRWGDHLGSELLAKLASGIAV